MANQNMNARTRSDSTGSDLDSLRVSAPRILRAPRSADLMERPALLKEFIEKLRSEDLCVQRLPVCGLIEAFPKVFRQHLSGIHELALSRLVEGGTRDDRSNWAAIAQAAVKRLESCLPER